MKTTTILLLLFFTVSGFSQIYGDLFMDKRGVAKEIEYTVNHSQPGKLVFDIAVDIDGNVTSCELNEEKSTITFSGAVIQGKNKILQHLKFESGYQWPKFHRGYIQLNTVQGVKKEDNQFAPPPQ